MVGKIFPRVSLAHVNNEALKAPRPILLPEFREWGNLPHEWGSGDAPKLQNNVLSFSEVRQRNSFAVKVGQSKIRCFSTDLYD